MSNSGVKQKNEIFIMRHVFPLLLVLLCNEIQAQKKDPIWFNLEPKAGISATMLLNNNISNDKNIKPVPLNTFLVFGAGLGIQFTRKFSTQIELLKTDYGQAFKYSNNVPDNNVVKINATDLVFVFRGTNEGMGYSGLGLKQSYVSNVSDGIMGDVSGSFNKSFISVILDLGIILYHNNIFDINLNLRFGYAISDAGKNTGYQPGGYPASAYGSYKPTNPASAQITFNFNWHMGYFATAQCKQKKGFVFFTY